MEQEIVSGSGISWAICKSAPHPRHNHTSIPLTKTKINFRTTCKTSLELMCHMGSTSVTCYPAEVALPQPIKDGT